ncbi:MAG TPA: helix-turn-helix transcriptional regulator [Bryobacteraceae bacterium]|jgi:DNA-binding XRE family transcriptional regulator|nr:helix-turn-helix transcriptional regulator [Bryobacteraceae bacterium]
MYPNLKLQLWRSGLRQNRLARILNLDEATLSRIVNGFREPSLELKHTIADLLHCDTEWLFQREDNGNDLERYEERFLHKNEKGPA